MKVSLSRRAVAARRRLSVVVWMQIGVLLFGQCSIGFANPNGGTVVSGSAAISSSGNLTTINQSSNRAIINWRGFSIGAGETTQFIQPGANSAILNRVTGAQMSQLMGTLQANGQVFLINPNGILIGSGATINVGGFTASTLDVSNSQFMQGGDLTFSGSSKASVINQGNVTAIGGDIYLIGAHVENHGTLNAANGTVGLAAGQEVKLVDSGSQALVVRATGSSLGGTGVLNTGVINGVRAELAANGGNVYALAINNTGVVRATGAVRQNGRVLLTAPGGTIANSGNLIARNADGSGGQVTINSSNGTSGETNVSGHIDVSGTTGGRVEVLGDEVNLTGATIDAHGTADGGVVLIGGDYQGNNTAIANAQNTTVDAATTINADSTTFGDGGRVIIWADGHTDFAGIITARGGADEGNGGFVEVSGKQTLAFGDTGFVDTTAANGETGTLLLDPGRVNIGTPTLAGFGTQTIAASTVRQNWSANNIIITTADNGSGSGPDDINVWENLNPTFFDLFELSTDNSFTLNAARDINLFATVRNTGNGDFSLSAGRDVNFMSQLQSGAIVLGSPVGGGTIDVVAGRHVRLAADPDDASNSFSSLATRDVRVESFGGNINITAGSNAATGGNFEVFGANGNVANLGSRFGDVTISATSAPTGNRGNVFIESRGGRAQVGFDRLTPLGVGPLGADITIAIDGRIDLTADGAIGAIAKIGHGGDGLFSAFNGDINITQGERLRIQALSENSTAQIGHGGPSTTILFVPNVSPPTGDITVNVDRAQIFANGEGSTAMLGHGGRDGLGTAVGDISLTVADNLRIGTFDPSQPVPGVANQQNANAQIGHGGRNFDASSPLPGSLFGKIDVTSTASGLTMEARGTNDVVQIGHGGLNAVGSTGNITVSALEVELLATGAGSTNQIGHGGPLSTGDHVGNIMVEATGVGATTGFVRLEATGGASGTLPVSTSQIGHGGAVADGTAVGNIVVNAAGSHPTFGGLFLSTANSSNVAQIGHGGEQYVGTSLGGNIDVTASAGMVSLLPDSVALVTTNGNITVTADEMVIAAGIDANDGIVTLRPFTPGRTIDLGTETVGSLSLTDTEIDFVTAGILRIGSADAGDITFSSTISPAQTDTLSLITGNRILDTNVSGADVQVANLALRAVNGIADNETLDTNIGTLAALNTTDNSIAILEIFGGGDLTIGSVDGLSGVLNQGAGPHPGRRSIIIETNNGNLTVAAGSPITAEHGGIFLVAQQGNGGAGDSTFTNNAAITMEAGNGDIEIIANNMDLGTVAGGSSITTLNGARIILSDDPSNMAPAPIEILLGGAEGVNTLGLTNDELNTVSTSGVLQIGRGSSGNITFSAPVTLTNVNTLDLETGLAVLDGTGTEQADLTVGNLAIRSGAGIGTVGNDLNIAATNLAFNNTGGAVNLHNTGALTIVSLDGLTTSSNSGTTTAITTASPLTFAVDTISAGSAVHTAGEISDAPTFADVLTVNPGVTVQSMTGDLTLQAGDNVVLGAGSTASAAGTLNITAGFGDLDMGGTLLIDPTANLVGNPINLTSFEDYAVDVLNVPGVTLNITSTNGAILDGNDPPDGTLNITAELLTLNANTGIGGAGNTATLETQVDNLEAITNTGGIFVANTGDLTIGGVSAGLNGVQVATAGDIVLSTTGNMTVNEEIGIAAGDGDILLLAPLDINVNASILNQTTGATSLVAGWDSVTSNIATILGDHSTFGIGGGSVFIGDGSQTSGISVGSRFGATNVAAADLTIRGSDTNSAGFAQFGFQGNGDINGPILVNLSDGSGTPGNLTVQAGNAYAQLGHGGRSANGNQTGDITIVKANDILVTGGSNFEAYAQIGHGGEFAFGDQSGDITIGQANDITFTAGSRFATYAQLGHGGYATFGDQTGNITIVRANDITFTGDDGFAAYAQLGHGGAFAFGDQTGDISTGRLNNVKFTAGSGSSAYAQFGHGGDSVFGNQTGNINIEVANDLTFTGDSGFAAYAQLGHGGAGVNGDQTGDINIWRANNLFFEGGTGTNAYAQLGHGGTALFIESEGEFEVQFNGLGLSLANQTGNITISQANDIFFNGGDGFASYSQLGHGGFDTIGNQTGNISVRLVGSDLFLTGGTGPNAYAQLGHGAAAGGTIGFRTGDIRVIIDGTAALAGGSATAPAWLGHRTTTPGGINGDLVLAIDQIDPLADNGGRLFMNQFSAIDMGGLPNQVRIFGTRRFGNTLADGAMINGVVVDSSLPPGTFTGDRWNPNFEFVTWNHEQWGWTYNQFTLAQPGPYTAPFTFYYLGVFNIFPDLPPQLTAFNLPYDRFVRYSDYADSIFQMFPNGPYRMYYGLWSNRPQEDEETGANSAHTYSDWNYSEAFGLTGGLPYE